MGAAELALHLGDDSQAPDGQRIALATVSQRSIAQTVPQKHL